MSERRPWFKVADGITEHLGWLKGARLAVYLVALKHTKFDPVWKGWTVTQVASEAQLHRHTAYCALRELARESKRYPFRKYLRLRIHKTGTGWLEVLNHVHRPGENGQELPNGAEFDEFSQNENVREISAYNNRPKQAADMTLTRIRANGMSDKGGLQENPIGVITGIVGFSEDRRAYTERSASQVQQLQQLLTALDSEERIESKRVVRGYDGGVAAEEDSDTLTSPTTPEPEPIPDRTEPELEDWQRQALERDRRYRNQRHLEEEARRKREVEAARQRQQQRQSDMEDNRRVAEYAIGEIRARIEQRLKDKRR